MPIKQQPKTLFKQCLEISVDVILSEWRKQSKFKYEKYLISDILQTFPPSVLDNLVSTIFYLFIEIVSFHGNEFKPSVDGSLSLLLGCILSCRLRVLDLNSLSRLQMVPFTEAIRSEKIILKSLSHMKNLVYLSFKANRYTHITIVVGDDLLREISYNCPKLRLLDVSHNQTVTNIGLNYLWKKDSVHCGCHELLKLIVYGCAVTAEGVAKLLKHLTLLKSLVYEKTVTTMMCLNNKQRNTRLNLTYLKIADRQTKPFFLSHETLHTIFNMCPNLSKTKFHVTEATLEYLKLGPNINTLHLTVEMERKKSDFGKGFVKIITNYGYQLTTLFLICSNIKSSHFLIIGRHCKYLKTLVIKSDSITDRHDNILRNDFQKCSENRLFLNLENMFLSVESDNDCIGMKLLPYILYSTNLQSFYISMNSCLLFTDQWLEEIFTLFNTKLLESFVIELPSDVFARTKLLLTINSVELILDKCPKIRFIGNLFTWCISAAEVKELGRTAKLENNNLEFIYHRGPFCFRNFPIDQFVWN